MNNFIKHYPVYYINIDSRTDRNDYILDHFKDNNILNFNKISACTPDQIPDRLIEDAKVLGLNKKELATVFSHLKAMEYFITNSNEKYALICEDDVDLENIKKMEFSVDQLFDVFKLKVECVQLSVCTREDIPANFKIRLRSFWDFCCGAYLVTREYAEKIISYYKENDYFNLKKYKKNTVLEYRNGKTFLTPPVAECVVYEMTDTFVCPIATFIFTESSIDSSDEKNRQIIKSNNDFYSFWSKYKTIRLVDLIA